ncbi:MAG: hypothetical protein ABJN34_12165 [Litoreibacter sp.]|uniref:hypothetical protein n=1 Tax=Litoreibacter sp. TaxID=1969459 RepID=UPI0032985F3A
MKRIAAAILALTLAGCATPEYLILEEPIIAETTVEAAPHAKVEECVPGEDDGIGGTGCSVD